MSNPFQAPIGVLPLAAIAGTAAYVATQRSGKLAGHLVWLAMLGVAFLWLRGWYPRASGCDGPATIIVPFIGAFTAATGAWCGIVMADKDESPSRILIVPMLSVAHALIPGVFFLLTLWPCR